MRAILFSSLCFLSFGSGAAGDEFDDTTLFAKGRWMVELTHNIVEGNLWCSAETRNGRGQTFSLVAYEDNHMTLFVFDERWDLRPRPIRFLVDVDYSRWTMDGEGSGIGVSLTMNEPRKAAMFLVELQKGSAVAVYNDAERRLATFSLSGSSASIDALFECWRKISRTSDPFTDQSDPFGTSTDPFH